MGKLREHFSFSSNSKLKKSVLFTLKNIDSCPECKQLMDQIKMHARMGHVTVDNHAADDNL